MYIYTYTHTHVKKKSAYTCGLPHGSAALGLLFLPLSLVPPPLPPLPLLLEHKSIVVAL
jgi:hypothetical protein